MIVTGAGRVAGIIGWPVSHSLSPQLHGYWLEELGIDGVYIPLAVRPGCLESALKGLRAFGFCGANVTVPHKEEAFCLVDGVDPTAQQIGAVNTLSVIEEGQKILGLNTDAYGFLASLDEVDPSWRKSVTNAVILGAGGAARAIIVALLNSGISHVSLVNRTVARAERLGAEFGDRIQIFPWSERHIVLRDTDLLINTTTLGMQGHSSLRIDLSGLAPHAWVADIVYRPLETELLSQARQRNLKTVDGLGMLMHQGVLGFEIWFGIRPSVTAMVRSKMEALLGSSQ